MSEGWSGERWGQMRLGKKGSRWEGNFDVAGEERKTEETSDDGRERWEEVVLSRSSKQRPQN